jgi:hypothetical protein
MAFRESQSRSSGNKRLRDKSWKRANNQSECITVSVYPRKKKEKQNTEHVVHRKGEPMTEEKVRIQGAATGMHTMVRNGLDARGSTRFFSKVSALLQGVPLVRDAPVAVCKQVLVLAVTPGGQASG